MQTLISEPIPSMPLLAGDAEFEFIEPKRLVLSPIEVCMLTSSDDLFDDED